MSVNPEVNPGRRCRKPASAARENHRVQPTTTRSPKANQERPCRLPAVNCENSIGETIATDQHYTPAELGKVWHWSSNTVRRVFADEPGVLMLTAAYPSRNPRRRRMVQMRIPARVAMRVHARLSNS